MLPDRLREYRDAIDGDFVPLIEAERFYKLMADEYPDELAEWIRMKTIQFVADELTGLLRRERATARRRASARAFGAAMAEHEAGNSEPLRAFAAVHVINEKNVRRRVGSMTGPDCGYVANQYEIEGKRALTLASFWRAVEKKVGDRRIDEVYTEEQFERMLASFLRPAA